MARPAAHQVSAVCLAMLIGLAASGCAKQPLDEQGQKLFYAGHQAFRQGQYDEADQLFSEVVARNPSSWALSEVYYFRGLTRLQLGQRGAAKTDFREGATRYGRELTQVYSAVALANLEYEEGDDATAVHLYQEALERPVGQLPMDAVLYRYAVSLQRTGQWARADEVWARLLSEHPHSPLADHARRRFQARGFTVQIGAFSELANAERAAAKARADGFDAEVRPPQTSGRMLYTVAVGRYRSHEDARTVATQLKGRGYSVMIKP